MPAWSELVQHWEMARLGAAAEVRALDPAALDERPDPGARTARELASHLMQAGRGFVAAFEEGRAMTPGGPGPSPLPETAGAEEIAQALEQDWQNNLKPRLQALHERADVVCDGFYGSMSLLGHLCFAIGHEMYHRGQLATYVRLSGEVPALTRRITGMQASPRGAR